MKYINKTLKNNKILFKSPFFSKLILILNLVF